MNWWNRLWHRKQVDEQLEKELTFHLEEHTSELIAQGYDPGEARRRAQLDLGGPEQVKEHCRDARGTRWFEDLLQELVPRCFAVFFSGWLRPCALLRIKSTNRLKAECAQWREALAVCTVVL
jgi:hypothetical protein